MSAQARNYFIGGGIGSLAAAAFMIRDGGVSGGSIRILEEGARLGGSLDGAGDAAAGYSLRGGRMFTAVNYECTWDLFKSIPSLETPGMSVYEETAEFNLLNPSHALARLVDRRRAIVPAASMGFTARDRLELWRLFAADEASLDADRITDRLSPGFFETSFWFMWSTTFAFQPWHSAAEFRRYLHRFILEFPRIETLGGVKRTIYNQYDSLVLPLTSWLRAQGVELIAGCRVTAMDHESREGDFVATGLRIRREEKDDRIPLETGDRVFLQNASMTDASSLGSMTTAPPKLTKADSAGWTLWEALAEGRPEFGDPSAFNACVAQSAWQSFTVTLKDSAFFDAMEAFSGNCAGTGGLVTLRDSNWLMSVVLAHQPHFLNQPPGVQVFWGYALFPDRVGDFVAKPMEDCTGAEILEELRGHLRLDADVFAAAVCIPCRMPYITSMFMPRRAGQRPSPRPKGARNLSFISQFVEIPEDTVFTVEYSVRAAQLAAYGALGIDRKVPAVTPHDRSPRALFSALLKAFA